MHITFLLFKEQDLEEGKKPNYTSCEKRYFKFYS